MESDYLYRTAWFRAMREGRKADAEAILDELAGPSGNDSDENESKDGDRGDPESP